MKMRQRRRIHRTSSVQHEDNRVRACSLKISILYGMVTVLPNFIHKADASSYRHPGRRAPDAKPIDYGGEHPFELMDRARDAQEENKKRNLQLGYPEEDESWKFEPEVIPPHIKFDRSRYEPLRIKFDSQYLPDPDSNSPHANHTKFIVDYVMPRVIHFFSITLSIFRPKKLYVNNDYCTMASAEDFVFGYDDRDLMLFLVANEFCEGGTFSLAESCDWDDYDRPIGGNIYFCFDAFPLNEDGTASDMVKRLAMEATIHEVAHVLGLHELDMAYYYDVETGQPRTPRPVEPSSVTCADGKKVDKEFDMPSNETVQRGQTEDGIEYFELVTPRALQAARNHFDCQTMSGVRLENQHTSEFTCIGNHVEERLYLQHVMSAVAPHPSIPNFFSPITLAIFEDTGWYVANYSMAQTSPFGRGRGCDFVEKPCLVNDGQIPDYGEGLFCNSTDKINDFHCDPTHHIIATCDMTDYASDERSVAPPIAFQWFNESTLGAKMSNADYCPTWTQFVWDCKAAPPKRLFAGETYGNENSRCVDTGDADGRPLCVIAVCNAETQTVDVELNDGTVLVCEEEGQILNTSENTTLKCPNIAAFCPDMFCPSDCSGRGVCNYEAKPKPKCECFDSSDTSPTCSSINFAQIPHGEDEDVDEVEEADGGEEAGSGEETGEESVNEVVNETGNGTGEAMGNETENETGGGGETEETDDDIKDKNGTGNENPSDKSAAATISSFTEASWSSLMASLVPVLLVTFMS